MLVGGAGNRLFDDIPPILVYRQLVWSQPGVIGVVPTRSDASPTLEVCPIVRGNQLLEVGPAEYEEPVSSVAV